MRRSFSVLYCVASLLLYVSGNCQTPATSTSAPTEGRMTESIHGESIPAISGKPFSARVVLESTKQLNDGTHITHTTYNIDARDTQGRTRTEGRKWINPTTNEEPRLTSIELYDPTTRTRTDLFPLTKVARQWVVGTSSTSAPDPAAKPDTKQESLGSEVMEGLPVQGTRTTEVYPAGAVGNDRPLTIVTESWFSEDLRIALLTRRNDPRYGVQTVRVTELVQQEPDASLFDIPKDYKVTNESTTPVAGLELLTESEGVNFNEYLRGVYLSLKRSWFVNMPASVQLGDQGINTVEFRILQDGSVPPDFVKMVRKSDKSALDAASLRAVREAGSFGHLPEKFSKPFILLRFTFYYNVPPPKDSEPKQ